MIKEISEEKRIVQQYENNLELLQERIAELEFFSEDQNWQRINSGDNHYELSRAFLTRIVARSRIYFLHNPLIRRGVSIQTDYIFGQGVNIQAIDDNVNEVLQEFLDNPANVRELIGHQASLMKEQTLLLDGNVFMVLQTDVMTGEVILRSILVDEITQIITNPDDANEPWYYKREWHSIDPTSSQIKQEIAYYPDMDHQPRSNSRPQSIGVYPIRWDSPIYHIKTGQLAKSKFGVPEVYPALDWAQAFKKFLENWSTIVEAYARFAFKLTVPGGRNSIVAAREKLGTSITGSNVAEHNPPSIAGSMFTANKDGATLDPIKTSGATTAATDGREMKLMVASALGIPDTMLSGDAATGNLATAQTLDRPTELKFRSRQQMWKEVYTKIINYVIKWATITPQGKLHSSVALNIDKQGGISYSSNNNIEVAFPSILEHSIKERIDAVTEAVTLNGKAFIVDSEELQKLTLRLMFQALGLANTDELVTNIFDTIKEPVVPPSINNNPQQGQGNGSDTGIQNS